jgi:hypothetical protein
MPCDLVQQWPKSHRPCYGCHRPDFQTRTVINRYMFMEQSLYVCDRHLRVRRSNPATTIIRSVAHWDGGSIKTRHYDPLTSKWCFFPFDIAEFVFNETVLATPCNTETGGWTSITQSAVIDYGVEVWDSISGRDYDFKFATTLSTLHLGSTEDFYPKIQSLFLGEIWTRREVSHTSPSSAEVKNSWNCTFTYSRDDA